MGGVTGGEWRNLVWEMGDGALERAWAPRWVQSLLLSWLVCAGLGWSIML